jgi:hypothetical protein
MFVRFGNNGNNKNLMIVCIIASFLTIVLSLLSVELKVREKMTSNWDIAENSYDDNDCISTWDKVVGGVQSLATFGSFNDIDRAKLVEEEKIPKHTTCIKRTANYTLVCPDETLYVYGCNGVKYKNACMAERDGVYNYSTDNGVVINDDG